MATDRGPDQRPWLAPPPDDDRSGAAEFRRGILKIMRDLGIALPGSGTPPVANGVSTLNPPEECTQRIDTDSLDVTAGTPYLMGRAARLMERGLVKGSPQGEARQLLLMEIGRAGPMVSWRLSRRLGVPPSTLSRSLRRAIRDGQVRRRRVRSDRRMWLLELTPEGRRVAAAAAARWRAADEQLLAGLTAAERDELRRLLRKAGRALDRHGRVV